MNNILIRDDDPPAYKIRNPHEQVQSKNEVTVLDVRFKAVAVVLHVRAFSGEKVVDAP